MRRSGGLVDFWDVHNFFRSIRILADYKPCTLTKKHSLFQVVDRLLSMPSDFWKAFINMETENQENVITNGNAGSPGGQTETPGKKKNSNPFHFDGYSNFLISVNVNPYNYIYIMGQVRKMLFTLQPF